MRWLARTLLWAALRAAPGSLVHFRPVHEWLEIRRSGLVTSVETSVAQDGTRVDKLRLSDRLKRIELIGKHVDVRAFVERKEVTGKDGGPIEAVMVFNPVGSDDDDPG